jgi:hypothetical protein
MTSHNIFLCGSLGCHITLVADYCENGLHTQIIGFSSNAIDFNHLKYLRMYIHFDGDPLFPNS